MSKKIFGIIDKTGTINPRGKEFHDPGGYGTIIFDNKRKLFYDLSETALVFLSLYLKVRLHKS